MHRIVIADDHILIRKGLIQVLKEEFPSAIIEETSDAEALIKKVLSAEWDLVITDISMPGKSGLDILQEIKRHAPKLPVLVLSMFPEEQYAIRALKAGAAGYLNKMSAPEEIIKAIRTVSLGKKYITPLVAEQLAGNLLPDNEKALHESLSAREFEIFTLLAAGKSVSDIAEQVVLSTSSISTYRARILKKLHLRNNADIIFYSLGHNMV
ncbi:MAG: response regulator transcription factor [Chitinophagaceae bacterium]